MLLEGKLTEAVPPPDSQSPSQPGQEIVSGAKARPKPVPFESVASLLEEAFRRKGKPVPITPATRKALANAGVIPSEVGQRLLDESKSDVLLAVPLGLLRAGQKLGRHTVARRELVRFVGEVARTHFLFSSTADGATPLGITDARQAFSLLDDRLESAPTRLAAADLKKGNLVVLRKNVFHVLALWLFETRGTSIEEIVALLYRHLWRRSAEPLKADLARLLRLVEVREPAALGVACETFEAVARASVANAAEAQARDRGSRERLESVTADLKQAEDAAAEATQRIASLKAELADARSTHTEEITHGLDDRERIRAGALRAIRSEVTLLEDALGAARLSPPRTEVVVDHIERAIAGLRAEMKRLDTKS